MSPELERLKTEVAQNTTVTNSAVALLGTLAQLIRDHADDPAALNAMADELDANEQALAKAVTDNTPGGGAPTP